jgi:dCTP deaminase
MILADSEIRRLLDSGEIVIDPCPKDQHIQPASIDIHLANELVIFKSNIEIFPGEPLPSNAYDIIEFDEYIMKPGEFLLGSSLEYFEVDPKYCLDLKGKSTIARSGLTVHLVAGFGDPGFKGMFTLEIFNHHIYNNNTVRLKSGMKIAQIAVKIIKGKVLRPYGSKSVNSHYQGQVGPTPSRGTT